MPQTDCSLPELVAHRATLSRVQEWAGHKAGVSTPGRPRSWSQPGVLPGSGDVGIPAYFFNSTPTT